MGHKTALIDKIRAEKRRSTSRAARVPTRRPAQGRDGDQGRLQRQRGDVKKNWLKRYFVALNEADNYDILYFDKQVDDASLPSATTSRARARRWRSHQGQEDRQEAQGDDEAVQLHGEGADGEKLGPKMEGNDEQSWLVKFDNEGELVEEVRSRRRRSRRRACSSRDSVTGGFLNAYQATRYCRCATPRTRPPAHPHLHTTTSSTGALGYWHEFGTEEDMLGALLNEVLHRRILRDNVSTSTTR